MYEIYPREEVGGVQTPLGITTDAASFEVSLRPNQAQAIRFAGSSDLSTLPIVFGTSYTTAVLTGTASTSFKLAIAGVRGLSGSEQTVMAVVPAAIGANVTVLLGSAITDEGVAAAASAAVSAATTVATVGACAECDHWPGTHANNSHNSGWNCGCLTFTLQFGGDWVTEMMPVASDQVRSVLHERCTDAANCLSLCPTSLIL
jgi:hypothetical protein